MRFPTLLLVLILGLSLRVQGALDWVSKNLIVTKDEFVTLGSPASFSCELPAGLAQQEVTGCLFETPNDRRLVFKMDQSGDQLATGHDDEEEVYSRYRGKQADRVCGMSIEAVAENDLGDWTCVLTRSNGPTPTVRGRLNLRTSGRVPNVRLPTNTVPSHYAIDMVVVMEPEFVIDGAFAIDTKVNFDHAHDGFLTLHLKWTSIDEEDLQLLRDGLDPLPILDHVYDFEREMYTVQYLPPSSEEDSFSLTVRGRYFGTIMEVGQDGFYKDSYVDPSTGETVYLAATQFESAAARWAFPCLDEPGLKATFDIRIGRSLDYMSLSNMPRMEGSDLPVENYPGYVWDEYETSPVMSTYLNAFFVGNFVTATSGLFGTWARQDLIHLSTYSLTIGPQIHDYFGDLFSLPYPLPKQDQIAYPNKGGAMENWGLVTYGEGGLLIDYPSLVESSDIDLYAITNVVSHELAHQWFGNLVTCLWWDHIWLNEGFAVYMSFFAADHVEPGMSIWDRFYTERMRNFLSSDALPTSPVALAEVPHPADAYFASATRAGAALRMMEHFLTRETLFNGVGKYLTDLAYSSAVTDDLWFYLNREGHQDGTLSPVHDLGTLMDPWFKQRNYPLLTVTRDYVNGDVSLRQERFLIEEDTTGEDNHDYQWYVPLTYTVVSESDPGDFVSTVHSRFFLEPSSTLNIDVGTEDPTAAVIFNIQSAGLYRVNYDPENWDRLISLLSDPDTFGAIHRVNRAQLLHDSYFLAVSGTESYDLPLRVFSYLDNGLDVDYIPLAVAVDIYYRLSDEEDNLPAEGVQLRTNLFNALSARYSGMEPIPGNDFTANLFQRDLISLLCGLDFPACRDDAVAVFAQWMSTENPEVPVNNSVNRQARASIYCTAMRNGGQEEHEFLQGQLEMTLVPQHRSAITSGLSCYAGNGI